GGWMAIATMAVMILFVILGVLTMFKAMALAVVVLLVTRVISAEEAKDSVQFNILLLIASAFGIGAALEQSGAAAWVASGIVGFAQPLGMIAVLVFVYVLTNVFTELITN